MEINFLKKLVTSTKVHMELAGEGFLEKVMTPKQSFKGSTYNKKHKKYHYGQI